MQGIPADGKTTKELVAERLALSNGAETAGSDLLGVELNAALREVEAGTRKKKGLARQKY